MLPSPMTDGRTDRHDEANSGFCDFANAPKEGSKISDIFIFCMFLHSVEYFRTVWHE